MTTTPIDTERQALLARICELESALASSVLMAREADEKLHALEKAVVQPGGTIAGEEFAVLLHEHNFAVAVDDDDGIARTTAGLIAYIDARLVVAGMAQWISIADRLPEDADKSMGTNNEGYVWAEWTGAGDWLNTETRTGLARHIPSLGWQPLNCSGYDWNVSRWMRLPARTAATSAADGERKS